MPKQQRPRSNYRNLPYGAGSVRPRGARWEARWQESGTRKGKTFDTEDEAYEFLWKRWHQKRTGTYRPPSELTVEDLVTVWLERHQDGWTASTYNHSEGYAKTYAIPALGDIRAIELDAGRVQHWVDTMRREGKTPAVIRAAVRVVGQSFRDAIRLKLFSTDPTSGITLPKLRPKKRATWTQAEVVTVDTYLADDPCWLAVYRLALSTALRPGELMALQWSDIDLDAGMILVERTLTEGASGTVIVGETTKTGEDRAVSVPPPTVWALRQWKRAQAEKRLAAPSWDSRGFVLTSRKGTHLFPSTWYRKHQEIVAGAGVSRITLHGLRHTFATLALERNMHPRIVQEILGHASIQMTLDLYSHVSVDLQTAASRAFGEHLFGGDILEKTGGVTQS